MVRQLLAAGSEKERARRRGATPLWIAAAEGHDGVVAELLAARCNVNAVEDCGVTPLLIAAEGGHERVVRLLLAAGCEKDKEVDGNSALLAAVQERHANVVSALLSASCDTSSIVCVPDATLRGLFRQHFERLYFAFAMASHPRLGSGAGDRAAAGKRVASHFRPARAAC